MKITNKCTVLLLMLLLLMQVAPNTYVNFFEEDGGILVAQTEGRNVYLLC